MKQQNFIFTNKNILRFSTKTSPILKIMNRLQKNKTYGLLFSNQLSINFVIHSMLNIIAQPSSKKIIKKRCLF